MDFGFTEEQTTVQELAQEILGNEATLDRVKEAEASEHCIDTGLWQNLAEANLLGIAIPEEHGGMGMGLLELCCLLEEVGRRVAPVPVYETLVLGALPIARFGSAAQQAEWLPKVATGKAMLTAALQDSGSSRLAEPATKATAQGDGFSLTGTKRFVAGAGRADRVIVPAMTDAGPALFLVDPQSAGVSLTGGRTSTGAPLHEMALDGAVGEQLGDASGADLLEQLEALALVGLCAMQIGVSDEALRITSSFAGEREQFGVPIGSFQAVQHRAADGFIDLEALRWCTWRAAFLVDEGGAPVREARVAKYWAADAGSRIANSCVHLHGGMGSDTDYPIQRYFLWSRALELNLGGATPQLVELGRDLASNGVEASA